MKKIVETVIRLLARAAPRDLDRDRPGACWHLRLIWAVRVLTQRDLLADLLVHPQAKGVFIDSDGDVFETPVGVVRLDDTSFERGGRRRYYRLDHVAFAEVGELGAGGGGEGTPTVRAVSSSSVASGLVDADGPRGGRVLERDGGARRGTPHFGTALATNYRQWWT